jgi:hypothetical protein
MQKTTKAPSAWLAALPVARRGDMQRLDRLLVRIMKGRSRTLWEGVFWGGTEQTIIGYGDLTMTGARGKRVDWFVVGLALQKNYISLYVNVVDGQQYLAEKYRDRLGAKVKTGKASISFASLDVVDIDAVTMVVNEARERTDPARR